MNYKKASKDYTEYHIWFETFSKFNADEAVINEIRLGKCKVKLPSINRGLKFLKESFGDNFEAFIKRKERLL